MKNKKYNFGGMFGPGPINGKDSIPTRANAFFIDGEKLLTPAQKEFRNRFNVGSEKKLTPEQQEYKNRFNVGDKNKKTTGLKNGGSVSKNK
jgi:hypothetical protein